MGLSDFRAEQERAAEGESGVDIAWMILGTVADCLPPGLQRWYNSLWDHIGDIMPALSHSSLGLRDKNYFFQYVLSL